jgi:hypothetical protein
MLFLVGGRNLPRLAALEKSGLNVRKLHGTLAPLLLKIPVLNNVIQVRLVTLKFSDSSPSLTYILEKMSTRQGRSSNRTWNLIPTLSPV